MERGRNHRRTHDAGSCTSLGRRATKVQHLAVYGVFEREKCDDDLRETRQLKIQIWKSKFWDNEILRQYGRLNTATVQKYIREQKKQDQVEDSLRRKEYKDPFKGSK